MHPRNRTVPRWSWQWGGHLNRDGDGAYIEVLQFTLTQLGQPTQFDPATRQQITQALAQSYPACTDYDATKETYTFEE